MSGAISPAGVNTETRIVGPGELASASETAAEPTEFPCEFGGYRLLRLLGSGGMGSVYEAEELLTGRRVALKALGQKLDSSDMRQRFLREGRLAASVNHPNSVYVFGTEEIDGRPVISMEIASGGTLDDVLRKRGPLPVGEAVDAILDVISGLEAALAGGVLHRDVKPSNCFVSPDGTVKVGDFGLSVSTVATIDTFQTAQGVIMGTPAYAPPEQLRGGELDVRADIYSVGATLFSLLTNKPPVEGNNAVEVVAAALDATPKPVTEFRDDIPSDLAKVVARCLAKKPEQRYPDYASLRNELLPFRTAQPEPAPLGQRFGAWFFDCLLFPSIFVFAILVPALHVLGMPGYITGSNDIQNMLELREPGHIRGALVMMLFGVFYITICEGLWGAGLGKMLMGFRVMRPGGQMPGLSRAFVRGVCGMLTYNTTNLVAIVALTGWQYDPWHLPWFGSLVFGSLLFLITMRGRNGFATVWDLITATRVVVKPVATERPVIEFADEASPMPVETATIGPFSIIEDIVPGQWIAAQDPRLRRRVWLQKREPTGQSTATGARRDVARPGRSRWLQSVETSEATWDVFEAQAGAPLPSLIDDDGHLPWTSVRSWLYDIAMELAAAAQDDTLPEKLSLDHVWINAQGRAILLEEPWPATSPDRSSSHPSVSTTEFVRTTSRRTNSQQTESIQVDDLAGRQRFLHAIASHLNPVTVPLHAQGVLKNLAEGSFEKLSFVAGNLQSLLTKPVRVTRLQRAASILFNPWFFIAFTMGVGGAMAMPVPNEMKPAYMFPIAFAWYAVMQLLANVVSGAVLGEGNFGFAVINVHGEKAGRLRLAVRWLIAWSFPLLGAVVLPWAVAQPADSQQAESTERTAGRVTAEQIIGHMDKNGDGGIGKDEASEELKPHFEQIDTNKDGVIDVKEAQVMADYVNADIRLPAGTPAFLLLWLIGLAITVLRPHRGIHDQLTGCWIVPR